MSHTGLFIPAYPSILSSICAPILNILASLSSLTRLCIPSFALPCACLLAPLFFSLFSFSLLSIFSSSAIFFCVPFFSEIQFSCILFNLFSSFSPPPTILLLWPSNPPPAIHHSFMSTALHASNLLTPHLISFSSSFALLHSFAHWSSPPSLPLCFTPVSSTSHLPLKHLSLSSLSHPDLSITSSQHHLLICSQPDLFSVSLLPPPSFPLLLSQLHYHHDWHYRRG